MAICAGQPPQPLPPPPGASTTTDPPLSDPRSVTGPPRRAPQEGLLSVYQSLLCVRVCVAGRRCGCSYPQGPVPVPRSHLSAGAQDVAQAAAVTKTKVLGACSEKIKTKTKKETLLRLRFFQHARHRKHMTQCPVLAHSVVFVTRAHAHAADAQHAARLKLSRVFGSFTRRAHGLIKAPRRSCRCKN